MLCVYVSFSNCLFYYFVLGIIVKRGIVINIVPKQSNVNGVRTKQRLLKTLLRTLVYLLLLFTAICFIFYITINKKNISWLYFFQLLVILYTNATKRLFFAILLELLNQNPELRENSFQKNKYELHCYLRKRHTFKGDRKPQRQMLSTDNNRPQLLDELLSLSKRFLWLRFPLVLIDFNIKQSQPQGISWENYVPTYIFIVYSYSTYYYSGIERLEF